MSHSAIQPEHPDSAENPHGIGSLRREYPKLDARVQLLEKQAEADQAAILAYRAQVDRYKSEASNLRTEKASLQQQLDGWKSEETVKRAQRCTHAEEEARFLRDRNERLEGLAYRMAREAGEVHEDCVHGMQIPPDISPELSRKYLVAAFFDDTDQVLFTEKCDHELCVRGFLALGEEA